MCKISSLQIKPNRHFKTNKQKRSMWKKAVSEEVKWIGSLAGSSEIKY